MNFKEWFDGEDSFQMNLKTAERNFLDDISNLTRSMGEYLPPQMKPSFDNLFNDLKNPFRSTVASLGEGNSVSHVFSGFAEVESKLGLNSPVLSSLENPIAELYHQIGEYEEYHDEYKKDQISRMLARGSSIISGLEYAKNAVTNLVSTLQSKDENSKMIAYWYRTNGMKIITSAYHFIETVVSNMMNFAYDEV